MPEVDSLIRDMFVGGVSQQQVGNVVEQLTGSAPSPSTVSRVFHSLEREFAEWQKRPLPKRYVYAFADGTYFSVIYEGEGQKMPILALIGIREEGQREVVAFTTGERENQGAWENLLSDIKARGVETVDLWIYGWSSGDAQRDWAEVPLVQAAALCAPQDGEYPQPRAREATRGRTRGAASDLLCKGADSRPTNSPRRSRRSTGWTIPRQSAVWSGTGRRA